MLFRDTHGDKILFCEEKQSGGVNYDEEGELSDDEDEYRYHQKFR